VSKQTIERDVLPSINHYNIKNFFETVTYEQLKSILLRHDTIMRWGVLCDAKTKHLGAGIYRLWYEERG